LDNTARIWDAATGAELRVLRGHTDGIASVAVSAGGARIVTGADDNTARIWHAYPAEPKKLVAEAIARAPRCLTPAERQRFFIATPPARWCAAMAKWPYDDRGAFIEGTRLARDNLQDDAKLVFDAVLAHKPDQSERIFAAWVEGLATGGAKLIGEGKDAEANVAFKAALDKHPASAEATNTVWAEALATRGVNLIGEGKDAEADVAFKAALDKHASAETTNNAWAEALASRGAKLIGVGKDAEADGAFKAALDKHPKSAEATNTAWAEALAKRGAKLLGEAKDAEADGAFKAALEKNPASAKDAIFSELSKTTSGAIQNADSDPKREAALKVAQFALARAERLSAPNEVKADALYDVGRANDVNKRYLEAVEAYTQAERLGYKDAASSRFWAQSNLGWQLSEQGKPVAGLMTQWLNVLDAKPELLAKLEMKALKSGGVFVYPMALVHFNTVRAVPDQITDCDRAAAHPNDPLRRASGVVFDDINQEAAIAACDQALAATPNEARLLFQRGRAQNRAAAIAVKKDDKVAAEKIYAAALADLEASRALGYPMAINNLAISYDYGERVTKDEDKAAELNLEFQNRVFHCCWAAVARHLLKEAENLPPDSEFDRAAVVRVVERLTPWAAALGSEPARELLAELSANGILKPTQPFPTAKFSDIPPWFQGAKQ
jgi:tetratricopeptide (TPR) repeat protein